MAVLAPAADSASRAASFLAGSASLPRPRQGAVRSAAFLPVNRWDLPDARVS